MDKNQLHMPVKYLSDIGVTFDGKIYTVRVFNGEKSLTLELTRAQAINLFDELNDLIDLDLKGCRPGDIPPSKTKFRRLRRIYKDMKDYKGR